MLWSCKRKIIFVRYQYTLDQTNDSRCGNNVEPGDDLVIFGSVGACGITLVITDAGADCVRLNSCGWPTTDSFGPSKT